MVRLVDTKIGDDATGDKCRFRLVDAGAEVTGEKANGCTTDPSSEF
jgi:hypothetical protein